MLGEKEIWLSGSGRHCKIGQLGALEARHTARVIANAVGKGMRSAMRIDPSKELTEQEIDVMGALGTILEGLDDATLDGLTQTFAKKTRIASDDGKWTQLAPSIDLVFGGGEGLADWFEWLYAAVEFSCGPFFKRLLSLRTLAATSAQPAPQQAAEGQASPAALTGFSTESARVRRIEVSR